MPTIRIWHGPLHDALPWSLSLDSPTWPSVQTGVAEYDHSSPNSPVDFRAPEEIDDGPDFGEEG